MPEDVEQTSYEHVDQYPVVVDDYETRVYSSEERCVEYSDPEPPEHRSYEGGDDKPGSVEREVCEVEFSDEHEGERYVQLEEKRESHYEREHREKERHHRYTEHRGSSPTSRRHHSPSPRKKRSVSW